MKIFRDKTHTLITFNYRHQGQFKLAVTIMGLFSFSRPNQLLSYADFWRIAKKTFNFKQGEFIDLHMPKQKAEFFIKGSCYSYEPETRQSFVKINFDNQEKHLTVWGDRRWFKENESYHLSHAECFEKIPLAYNNAFGGLGHESNPEGKGLIEPPALPDGVGVANVELAGKTIKQPFEKPIPALLLPYPPTCPHQLKRFGTIDERWLNNESPYYPPDIDWLYFNRAPADQQREFFYKGDEAFSFIHMHPEKKKINGQLPGLRLRCFYKRVENANALIELNMNLDTIWLLPDQEKGILVWHGLIDTHDIAANDIEFIYSANESLAEAPKNIDYYNALLSSPKRNVPKKTSNEFARSPSILAGMNFNLDEEMKEIAGHLFPEKEKFLEQSETLKIFQGKTPAESFAAMEQYYQNRKQAFPLHPPAKPLLGREFSAAGISNYHTSPKGMQFLDVVKKQIRAKLSTTSSAQSEHSGPFKKTEQQIEYLQHISAIMQFRTGAFEKSIYSREDIINGFQQGKKFSGENLAGIDLSDLDLSRINLSGCNLSGCNLSRARLTEANLSMATLFHVNLSETLLNNANLTHALIKNSSLEGANFSECCLQHALIDDSSGKKCNFAQAILNHAHFKKCLFLEGGFAGIKANFFNIVGSTFEECDFSEARMQFANVHKGSWKRIDFTKTDLSHALFEDIQLSFIAGNNLSAPHLSFSHCTLVHFVMDNGQCERLSCKGSTLSQSSFSYSNLTGCNLMNAKFSQSHFTHCNLTHLCGNEQSNISMSCFEHCNLANSALLGGHYEELEFNDCILDASQVMKSSWKKGNLRKCSAKKFRFVNAYIESCIFQDINFFQGIFHSSIFENTEFSHCNLYNIPFTDCQRKEVTIRDCLVKTITLNQEEHSS
ncbi:DUF2169 domain-containing protein [Fluoribacter dumoffii]|uniref:DUF2169 family type VI secretion system accessory protein n=1 Tax=Fluoribacter dumoffii TaxID=463 RepID=UPI00026C7B62|nr:DUF2169 domain-containing protein [Fluoribacter dumoffii]MCW8416749.1 DUF2169 domain-containing protein [Fluoribacter dumoffii]MCW8455411.1 DUF2169 domain-containing protein [Fluoribacter dumoffii]MCW8460511.1 DUF2169 domain-containing protein [Fluoribacter dumoffii]MCW8483992.1 DUF2169 domain-containing protein [Fluoribacter dumoffii]